MAQDGLSEEERVSSAGVGAATEAPAAVPNAWKKSLLPNGSQGSGGWPEEAATPVKPMGSMSAEAPVHHIKSRAARPAAAPPGVAKARLPAAEVQGEEGVLAESAADDSRTGQDETPLPAPAAPAQPAAPKGTPMSWRKVLAGARHCPFCSLLSPVGFVAWQLYC